MFMKHIVAVIGLLLAASAAPGAEIVLKTPLDYQVVQRSTPGKGLVQIVGDLSEECPPTATIEARFVAGDEEAAWRSAGGSVKDRRLTATAALPAGGWWRLDVRVMHAGRECGRGSVAHVGIGEVFVVAGQSNSANHGEERQVTESGRVASFDGTAWRLANDPQAGASGTMGSFMPPLGDAIARRLDVPVGFIACGIGATSVREWLPKGATFPNPPTLEGRVVRLPDGAWASDGTAYAQFVARMKSMGPHGFRAVLWHQGESDANQNDASRTLPGEQYRECLAKVIEDSRRDIGWKAPWFVAQASYHVPGDEKSDDIRSAQASLWKDGIALEGPDSDALTGEMRERGGQGVHFSAKGLREHASRWADKVLPWLEQRWTAPRTVDGGTEWSDYAQLPECHSIGWVRANVQSQDTKRWDGVLDEAIWGTPSPQQAVDRNWDWKISDDAWREAVKQRGEGPLDEVAFDLWVPDGVAVVKGIVAISGHGSGENLFRHQGMRALARELHLALFKFVGNPMQRGFWPTSLLFQRLRACGSQCGHPELEHAPLFLYGHSNGTGFSAIFAADESARVWGWISMRPGITFQVYQPRAAQVPGLVIFGENDPFLLRPSPAENLAVVPTIRKRHDAVWSMAVEPKTGHGPGEKTWPLVFSFLRHSFDARVPADADCRQGPVKLNVLAVDRGLLGRNWDSTAGGYQSLSVFPFADFPGEKAAASWLLNAAYADDWQTFQRDGEVASPR